MVSGALKRKEFESFFSAPPFEMDMRRFPDDETVYGCSGQYVDVRTQLAWESWNRRAAIQPRREVPAPETEEPAEGTTFYVASPQYPQCEHTWYALVDHLAWLRDGLVYLSREDRDARVAAMLALEGRE